MERPSNRRSHRITNTNPEIPDNELSMSYGVPSPAPSPQLGASRLEQNDTKEPTPVPDEKMLEKLARSTPPLRLGDPEPPFGGLFTESEADVSLGIPTATERHLFTRFDRVPDPISTEYDPERTQNVSRILRLHIGARSIPTWYTAPYPEEYTTLSSISVCDMCLKYMKSDFVAYRHSLKCQGKAPPGSEIYRDGDYSVFEVDGAHAPIYCQQLCLMAKLFLDSKALYYDVQPFLFYVLTTVDDRGCHFIGYFSKLKTCSTFPAKEDGNNVSCIVTLPGLQRKGYGQFLISLSYHLTRLQETTGSPEKPLSDLGAQTYTKFWILHLCNELEKIHQQRQREISIADLSTRTGMTVDDVVYTLETLGWLQGGKLNINLKDMKERLSSWRAKGLMQVKPEKLMWTPLKSQINNVET